MILKRLTSVLTIKRKTSTDRQPTGFNQNNSIATAMIQDRSVTPIKLSTQLYESFDSIVGSSAQVTAGLATHSTVASGIASLSSGGSILILPGTYNENITLTQKVFLQGKGNISNINGTLTMNAGSDLSIIKCVRFGDNVTLNSNGSFFRENFLASGKTVTDAGTANSVSYVQE
jgi:hypothetical protein